MMIWPNFFIVGAARAGTTSLYEYLKKNPDVYMSPEKEPHYFSKVTPGRFRIGDEKSYLELFKDVKNETAIGEASTTYLRIRETPKLIHKKLPHAKIIIILRDPIDQFVSSYFFNKRQRSLKISLHDAIINLTTDKNKNPKKLINGYFVQVKRYLDIFGPNQVKILIFEEFVKNPKETAEDVLKFLGIQSNLKNFDAKIHNPNSYNNKEKLEEYDKEILQKFFQDDVMKLNSILGKPLPWPNFETSVSKPNVNPLTDQQENFFEENLIWLFGSSRGGTTWLGSQLLSHNTKIMFEPRIARLIGDRRSWVKIIGKKVDMQSRNPDYFFSNQTKKTWMYFLRKLILNRIYSQFPDISQKIVIKEPLERGGSDVISECLPDSKIIILLRDGRDVVDSKLDAIRDESSWGSKALARPPLNPNNRLKFIQDNSKMWVDLSEDLMRAYNNHAENLRILVRYEELLKNTIGELKKIYEFLQIEITNEKLEKIVTKYSFENIPSESKGQGQFTRFATPGKWNENFNEEEKNLINKIMGKTLKKLNYMY